MMVSVSNLESKVLSSGLKKQAPSFRGTTQAGREILKQISKDSRFVPRALMALGQNDGEILNTIVTGLGTAFVAPLFIAFNPFSKEDKETKIYSAWRQPISAVLAVAAQIGINIQYNRWLDNLASTGRLDRANLVGMPKESYLRTIINLEQPGLTKEELEMEITKRQMDARSKAVEAVRSDVKEAEVSFESMIDKDTYSKAEKQVKEQFKEQIAGLNKKEAKAFIAEKAKARAIENLKVELADNASVKLRMREFANGGFTIERAKADVLAEQAKGAASKYKPNVLRRLLEKLEVQKEYEALIKVPDFSSLKQIGNTFEEILQNVKIKKAVLTRLDNAAIVLGRYKKWGGIFISLATLPVSCGLLNWSYPRIMEKIMPEIAQKKKNKDNPEDTKKLEGKA